MRQRVDRGTTMLVWATVLATTIFASLASAQQPDGLPGQGQGQGQGQQQRGAVIPGQYIMVFKQTGEPVASVADRVRAQRPDAIEVFHQYSDVMRGCAIRLKTLPDLPDESSRSALINRIQANLADSIEYVEADQVVTTSQGTNSSNSGVDRIHASVGTSYKSVSMTLAAANVGIAIIDTGVFRHPDLNVSFSGFVAPDQGLEGECDTSTADPTTDCNGHGTHCAGIAAGLKTGVAPNTTIYPVKVLSRTGSGQVSGIILGLDWIVKRVVNNDVNPRIRVASMSLGGSASQALDDAVNKLANAGVVVVVAAGNSNANFAFYSPARASEVITVTAITLKNTYGPDTPLTDIPASYSNYAALQNKFSLPPQKLVAAPGTSIKSTWWDGGYNTISGTSMATPHVAGMVARCFGFSYKCSDSWRSTVGKCSVDAFGTTSRTTFLTILNSKKSTWNGQPDSYNGDPNSQLQKDTRRGYGWMGFAPDYDSLTPVC